MGAPVHFIELNLFGVYIAPMAAMMGVAYVILLVLRRILLATGLLRLVWHPALFQVALYLIVLSALVLLSYTVGMARLVP